MNESEQSQRALEALRSAAFPQARELFGGLLENFPENLEYSCGLFAAGYWDNRQEAVNSKKSGRTLAAYLIEEWERFDQAAEKRGFLGCLALQGAMQAVLGRATDEFRVAFQEDGGSSFDAGLLIELGKCLIKIEDYADAAEILNYCHRIHGSQAAVCFLLGESLCCLKGAENMVRGLSFYRDAFLLDVAAVDPSFIASQPAADVFEALYEKLERKLERVQEWFPAYLVASASFVGFRVLGKKEVENLMGEVERLSNDLERVVEKFRDKVRARLCFYCLVLCQQFSVSGHFPDLLREFEEQLQELELGIYDLYREQRDER